MESECSGDEEELGNLAKSVNDWGWEERCDEALTQMIAITTIQMIPRHSWRFQSLLQAVDETEGFSSHQRTISQTKAVMTDSPL